MRVHEVEKLWGCVFMCKFVHDKLKLKDFEQQDWFLVIK